MIAIPTTWDSFCSVTRRYYGGMYVNVRILASLLILTLSAGVSATVYESYDCSIHPDGSFSPDGTKIAYHSFNSEDTLDKIYIVNVDGTGATELMPGSKENQFSPNFSPDGTMIAYVSFDEDDLDRVYIVNTDGTGKRRLTTDASGREHDPHWSPAGTTIVYNGNVVVPVPAPPSTVALGATDAVPGEDEEDEHATETSTPGFGAIGLCMILLLHLIMRQRSL